MSRYSAIVVTARASAIAIVVAEDAAAAAARAADIAARMLPMDATGKPNHWRTAVVTSAAIGADLLTDRNHHGVIHSDPREAK